MQKNVANQIWAVFAFQDEAGANPGEPVTGDAGNITANVYLDGSATPNAVDDTNPTELGGGLYAFTLTAAECNADHVAIAPVSTGTTNVIGVPGAVWTTPASFNAGALALASDLATVDSNVDSILDDTGTSGVVLADDAITANKIAANAIGSSELADSAGDDIAARIAARPIVDSVASSATLPTHEQALYMMFLKSMYAVATGTTVSVKKVNGSTEAFTLTINNATNPTSILRT